MSSVVKLHLPAGNVRVVRMGTPSEERRARVVVGSNTDGTGVVTGEPPVSPSPIDEFQERMKAEFKAGFDEGRRQTEKHLRDDFTQNLAETQQRLDALMLGIRPELERVRSSAEKNVVKLALAIAERIVKREVAVDSGFALRQIHEAVKRIVGIERMKIRVNPRDEALVREYRTSILATTDAVRELAIEADETIDRGGCIIESDSGNVDAMIATQIEKIEAALLGGREEG